MALRCGIFLNAVVRSRDAYRPRRRVLLMSTQRRSTRAARASDLATQQAVGRGRLSVATDLAIPALLLCASGTATLIYQIVWIKQLSLVVGVDAYAVTTAVSAFFAGLALGGV